MGNKNFQRAPKEFTGDEPITRAPDDDSDISGLSDEQLLAELKKPTVEELSGPQKALFGFRSALEGHTAGISEPLVSGIKAAATTLSQGTPFADNFATDVKNRLAEKEDNKALDISAQIGGGLIPSPINVGARVFRVANAGAKAAGYVGKELLPTLQRGVFSGGVTGFGLGAIKEATGRPTGFVTKGDPVSNIARDTSFGVILGIPGELLINKLEASRAAQITKSPNAKKVVEAGKILKATPTGAQLTDSQLVNQLESSLEQTPSPVFSGLLGVKAIKDSVKASRDAGKRAVVDIGKGATEKTRTEIGSQVKKGFLKSIADRVAPAKKLYQQLESELASSEAVILNTNNAVAELKELSLTQPQIKSIVKIASDTLENVYTVDHLKNFRTAVGDMFTDKISPLQRRALTKIYNAVTADRKASLLKARPSLSKKLDEADEIWRSASEAIEQSLPFKDANPSSLKYKFDNVSDTRVADKIFNTTDIPKLQRLAKEFPKEFELLRTNRLRTIINQSKGNPSRLIEKAKALEPEAKAMIFGKDASKKIDALEVWINSMPEMAGPSGTPAGQKVFNYFVEMITGLGPIESAGKAAVYNLLTQPKIAPMVRRLGEQGINTYRQLENPFLVKSKAEKNFEKK